MHQRLAFSKSFIYKFLFTIYRSSCTSIYIYKYIYFIIVFQYFVLSFTLSLSLSLYIHIYIHTYINKKTFLKITQFDLTLYLKVKSHGFFFLILRDFSPVPSEQNVFVATHLGFLFKIIGSSSELFWKWTPSCYKTFYLLFCSVMSVLFRVVLYYIIQYLRKGVLIYLLYFKNYCLTLYIGNLLYTILQRFHLSFE